MFNQPKLQNNTFGYQPMVSFVPSIPLPVPNYQQNNANNGFANRDIHNDIKKQHLEQELRRPLSEIQRTLKNMELKRLELQD